MHQSTVIIHITSQVIRYLSYLAIQVWKIKELLFMLFHILIKNLI
jgi:hypothetical protein